MRNLILCANSLFLYGSLSLTMCQNNVDLISLFGKRVGECEVYQYKTGYKVLVSFDNKGKPTELYLLTRGNSASLSGISLQEKEQFISLAERLCPVGSRVIMGDSTTYTNSRNTYWDLYEHAVVLRKYRYDSEIDTSYLSTIAILYPIDAEGTISDLQKFQVASNQDAYIPKIYIGKCSYLALDRTLHVGKTGTFAVIGPMNEINGVCMDVQLKLP
jgi:hypothetical protein